ncbi:ATP-binding protein [Pseudanabaena sp. PCC 6802]|uniref:HAMP domain-containing sensor histidine kinase n=1 Tax=Pseudanabaena sp. PCC 6802 TaxID=118173 RepID=UPI00034C1950|nr:ATP-binding protein [Pseudanabaena sp. PCC 6802]
MKFETKPVFKSKLRSLLIFPFVLQIFAIVGLVMYLSYRSGQQAVRDLTDRLEEAVASRIEKEVVSFMEKPKLVNQVLLSSVYNGNLNVEDPSALEKFFFNQIKSHGIVPYLFYINKDGDFIAVQKLDNGQFITKVKDRSTGKNRNIYQLDEQGRRVKLVASLEFDPQEYLSLAQPDRLPKQRFEPLAWSEVSLSSNALALEIKTSVPVYSKAGAVQGVMGVELFLSQISNFLHQIKVSQSGQAFIIERSGEIIASSTSELPYRQKENIQIRLLATESRDSVTQATAKHLLQRFGDLKQITSEQSFTFTIDGNPYLVRLELLKDAYGLDWLTVVVIPEADFMGYINDNIRNTFLLCLLALFGAIALGSYTSLWLTRPIQKLKDASHAIAAGNFDQNVKLNRQDELGELSESFNTMANQLQTSFSALQSLNTVLSEKEKQLEFYNETLEQQVQERTQKLYETMDELKSMQEEIVQAEKMSALGHLVAGIAHEINTPLGAIKASISNITSALAQSLQELPPLIQTLSHERLVEFFTLLDLARHPQTMLSSREERQLRRSLKQNLQEQGLANADALADPLSKMGIQAPIDPILPLLQDANAPAILDTAYHLSSVQSNSQNIQLAVERAARIVYALKNYVRQDMSGTPVSASVPESIDLVLPLYQNQIKRGVEVTRTYQDVPPIMCYPEELSQVWSNLISNAIQAMDYKGELAIAVSQADEQIVVQFRDSGSGIPKSIQAQIFQPFFTTKPIGEGSGLGLSIVRKIIDRHHGSIVVTSKPGNTTFMVSLPLNFQLLTPLDVK